MISANSANVQENMSSPMSNSGRKDSLSLNVEFVKVNISRSRRGILFPETGPSDLQAKAANHVKFSG